MDIDSYVAEHGPEWRSLEAATAGGSATLARLPGPRIDEIVRLYLRASTHLAEVRTRYHDPRLEHYLSSVVSRAHAAIYGVRPRSVRAFLAVFGRTYRDALLRTLPFVLVMAGLLLSVGLAADLWTAWSREARAGLLPPWVREAAARSRGGGLVDLDPALASTAIFVNNVQVAVLAFVLGITLGIGTIWVVVQNALLIGSIAGAFQAAGRADVFWALVLPHGLLEVTGICIAAGAGLRIGWSLVEPGDLPRSGSLALAARDALLVVVGVVPAFGVAALIEGFVTGRTGLPWLEVGLGAVVAAGYLARLLGPGRRAREGLTVGRTP